MGLLITTSKKNLLFIWFSVFVVECKSSSRPSLERQLPLKLKVLILSNKLNKKFKIRKESLQINNVLFSLENNLKMVVPWLITTSKKNPLFIWFFASDNFLIIKYYLC